MYSKKSLIRIYTGITAGLLAFASCEKVINIDLKNGAPKLVVEGNITDNPGLLSHHVRLSQTTGFNSDGNSVPVSGAMVIIKDSTGNITDTLRETFPGDYVTEAIEGITGHVYHLSIYNNNQWYHSATRMPEVVSFDSLYTESFSFFGTKVTQFIPVFQDPAGISNYYRFIVQINDSVQNDINAWDDKITDGKINSRPLNEGDEELFHGNDTVTIEMRCLDKGIFDFFNTFYNASGNAQTPANPTSNISNGALGYFGAYTAQKRSIILP
jgi:hypothetical protein